ncbi:MAG: pilus assembly protein TadG-related protein [Planctomycetaceae bacterium]|nr:pilus assembly protein TadG-related protein [Planctomycetaceae bacterium]
MLRERLFSFFSKPRRAGMVLVWVVLLIVIFLGLAALVCDWACIHLVTAQLQNAADAGSLAGAQFVQQDANKARAQAVRISLANAAAGTPVRVNPNGSNDPVGDVVIGRYDQTTRTFAPTLISPNAVKVLTRRDGGSPDGPLPLAFASLIGISQANLRCRAIAMSASLTAAPAVLVLNPHAPGALTATGNGRLKVSGGDIQVDSDSGSGATGSGNARFEADNVNIVGQARFTGSSGVDGTLRSGADFIADPLADLPGPPIGPNLGAVSLSSKASVTINPGYYAGGITLSANSTITLNPGIYVLDGAGLQASGNGRITANGVMVYLKGSARLNLTGNASATITPPDPAVNAYAGADTYQGIAFFQDRANHNAATLSGTGGMAVDGAVYLPSGQLTLSGNGDTLGAQLIVDTLRMTGNGAVTINYDNGNRPPTPTHVFLVE